MISLIRILLFIDLIAITSLAFLPNYTNLPDIISISDLLNHTAAFMTLAFLYRYAFSHTAQRIVLTLLAYGAFIEIVQMFLPTRSASLADIGADLSGIVLGLVMGRVIAVFLPKREKGLEQTRQ